MLKPKMSCFYTIYLLYSFEQYFIPSENQNTFSKYTKYTLENTNRVLIKQIQRSAKNTLVVQIKYIPKTLECIPSGLEYRRLVFQHNTFRTQYEYIYISNAKNGNSIFKVSYPKKSEIFYKYILSESMKMIVKSNSRIISIGVCQRTFCVVHVTL